jgi:TolB-like protein/DNA-binding winged helix-turn-helix (wHTH) protein/Flp pilus assembly protein TadD
LKKLYGFSKIRLYHQTKMPEAQYVYEFGPFRLDQAERRLRCAGQPVPLPPKVFDTLFELVSNSGRLLTKEELLKRVWPGTFVEEANLAQNISAIRRALDACAPGIRYIETVPKSGYRFVAETRRVEKRPATAVTASADISPEPLRSTSDGHGRRSSTWLAVVVAILVIVGSTGWFAGRNARTFKARETVAAAATPIRSIAVLPIVNLSADPAQEYFSDGLTDELITRVAQVGAFQVISRTSVMGYKGTSKKVPEIGAELHVDSVVEGTVERVRDRVRIRVQLIRTATDQHVWAESYDREVADVLQLEQDVAREIAQHIGQLKREPEPVRRHAVPQEAHEEYLKGRYRWNERSETALRMGIGHFKRAIEVDPLYAEAYAGLADSYIMLENWGFVSPADAYPVAEAAARKALEIDDSLGDAYTSLAYATFLFDWDWSGAEKRLRRAIELNPNYSTAHHFYSVYLMAAGRHEEAQREIERARDLDPLSPAINGVVSWIYYEGRSYDKAMEQCRRAVDMNPAYANSRLDLGGVYMVRGEYEKALVEFGRAQAIVGDTPSVRSYLAQGYALSGNKERARGILQGLLASKFVSPWELALIYDALGERNQALTQLERAADQRASWIVIMASDPRLDDLHADSRFNQLIDRVHIPGRPAPRSESTVVRRNSIQP